MNSICFTNIVELYLLVVCTHDWEEIQIEKEFILPKRKEHSFPIKRVFRMVETMVSENAITVVQGFQRIGKTTSVLGWAYWHRSLGEEVLWFDCKYHHTIAAVNKLEDVMRGKKESVVVVVDHVEAIIDTAVGKTMEEMLCNYIGKRKVVVITKGRIADRILDFMGEGKVNLISGTSLLFTNREILQYVRYQWKKNVMEEEICFPVQVDKFPIAVNIYITYCKLFGSCDEKVQKVVAEKFLEYFIRELASHWQDEFKEFILRMVPYKEITREVVVSVYGEESRLQCLESFAAKCCLVVKRSEGCFFIVEPLKECLDFMCRREYSLVAVEHLYLGAADYYLHKKCYNEVFDIYIKIQDYKRLSKVLMMGLKDIGFNHKMMQKCFKVLPKNNLRNHIILCFWSVFRELYLLKPDGVGEWFGYLEAGYEGESEEDKEERNACLLVLSMVMPKTNLQEVSKYLNRVGNMKVVQVIVEMTIGNASTLISMLYLLGRWSGYAELEQLLAWELFCETMGRKYVAVLKLCLAIQYTKLSYNEKAQEEFEKVIRMAKELNMEVLILTAEILARSLNVECRQGNQALEFCNARIERIVSLMHNEVGEIRHYLIVYHLRLNHTEEINQWLGGLTGPYYAMNHVLNYRDCMNRIRVYIMLEDYYTALVALETHSYYGKEFHWECNFVECYMLYAIIFYRKKEYEKMLQYFLKGYLLAKKHRYLRIITEEGAAILPVLEMIREQNKMIGTNLYFKELYKETRVMAKQFPNYLLGKAKSARLFGEKEGIVLKGLARKGTLREIAGAVNGSVDEVKELRREIYRKLNVNNPSDAINAARELGYL